MKRNINGIVIEVCRGPFGNYCGYVDYDESSDAALFIDPHGGFTHPSGWDYGHVGDAGRFDDGAAVWADIETTCDAAAKLHAERRAVAEAKREEVAAELNAPVTIRAMLARDDSCGWPLGAYFELSATVAGVELTTRV